VYLVLRNDEGTSETLRRRRDTFAKLDARCLARCTRSSASLSFCDRPNPLRDRSPLDIRGGSHIILITISEIEGTEHDEAVQASMIHARSAPALYAVGRVAEKSSTGASRSLHALGALSGRIGLINTLSGVPTSEWCQEASQLIPRSFPYSKYSAYLRRIVRADERTRTADLLITSDPSHVAGVCLGLQIRHI
jgi:hypothetical protein